MVSSAGFRARVARRTRLRLLLTQVQAGACYGPARSRTVTGLEPLEQGPYARCGLCFAQNPYSRRATFRALRSFHSVAVNDWGNRHETNASDRHCGVCPCGCRLRRRLSERAEERQHQEHGLRAEDRHDRRWRHRAAGRTSTPSTIRSSPTAALSPLRSSRRTRTYSKRIDTPGTYPYHDALHPTLKGTVKVTGAPPSVSIARIDSDRGLRRPDPRRRSHLAGRGRRHRHRLRPAVGPAVVRRSSPTCRRRRTAPGT